MPYTTGGSSSGSSKTDVTLTYGNYVAFAAGQTYSVTMAGGSVFRCTVDASSSSDRNLGTFNGNTFTLGAWQTQATANNPGSGTTVTFVVSASAPSDLKCSTDW